MARTLVGGGPKDYTASLRIEPELERRFVMKNCPATRASSSTGLHALAFLLALAAPLSAQSGPPRAVEHTDPAKARFEETNRREMQLRNNPGATAKEKPDAKQLAAATAQVKLDFERILTLHNNMVRAVTGNQRLDFALVADATAEIKKRASRLQTTLALQKLDTD